MKSEFADMVVDRLICGKHWKYKEKYKKKRRIIKKNYLTIYGIYATMVGRMEEHRSFFLCQNSIAKH